jgi:hypothetical protein
MDDTKSDIAEKVRELFQLKSPIERLKMGLSMHETSKYLVARSIYENTPIYSGAELRREMFLRFYGDDFDPEMREKILRHFEAPKSIAKPAEEKSYTFEHIPETEKKKLWWLLLYPLVQARLQREKRSDSKLLKVLNNVNGLRTWKDIKNVIEVAINNVQEGKRILGRTAEIKGSRDPDSIIDNLFAELQTALYLLIKGFKNIRYFRRDQVDFHAEFEGSIFHIETTYVQGPNFKTQEYVYGPPDQSMPKTYRIRPNKLIRLLKKTYANKQKQLVRHQGTPQNSLLFMVTDLEETYAPWLAHASIQGIHPLLQFILDCEFPTVLFGAGSVYEPHPTAWNGVFGQLAPFNWENYRSFSIGERGSA